MGDNACSTRASSSQAYSPVGRAAHDPPSGPHAALPSAVTAASGLSQLFRLPQPIDLQGARIKLTLSKIKLEIDGVQAGLKDVEAKQLAPLVERVDASARAVCAALSGNEDKAVAVSRAAATLTREIHAELNGRIELVDSELQQELGALRDGMKETAQDVEQRVERLEKAVKGQTGMLRGWQEKVKKVEEEVRWTGERILETHTDLARRVEVLRSSAEAVAKVTPAYSISAVPDPTTSRGLDPVPPASHRTYVAATGFTGAAWNATSLTHGSGLSRPSLTATEPFSLPVRNTSPGDGLSPAVIEYQTSTALDGVSIPAAGPCPGPFVASLPRRRRAKTALPAALDSRPSPRSQFASTALLPVHPAPAQTSRSAFAATLERLAEPAKDVMLRSTTRRRLNEQDEEAHEDDDDDDDGQGHRQQNDVSQPDHGRNAGILIPLDANSSLSESAYRNKPTRRKRRRRIIEQDSTPSGTPEEQVTDDQERPPEAQTQAGYNHEAEEENEELGERETQE
ncbi:hypothetical protein JCM21900_003669 [Sporobolomyces salmonicolor]